jgi:hypothetical protein
MKIAVIGAGIFGTLIAVELANRNLDVTLIEKNREILDGATPRSQNRLHLGLHYPRDLATAKQSVEGFRHFQEQFGDAVNLDFHNYYAISKLGSKVSTLEFQRFCNLAGIEITPSTNGNHLPNGIALKNVESVWQCGEGVIDMDILREQLKNLIFHNGIKLLNEVEVLSIAQSGQQWVISFDTQQEEEFDFVVRCTYSSDSIVIKSTEYKPTRKIFQRTMIQVVESEENNFGITIIDGDFLTILPQGFSTKLLAYGPSVSTRQVAESIDKPIEWSWASKEEIKTFQKHIKERIDSSLDNWDYRISSEYLETIRTIEVGVEATDRRTSHVVMSAPRFIDVWSGKIDHAVGISKDIAQSLQSNY